MSLVYEGIVSQWTLDLAKQRIASYTWNDDFDREIWKTREVTWKLLWNETMFFADWKIITWISAQILAISQTEEYWECL